MRAAKIPFHFILLRISLVYQSAPWCSCSSSTILLQRPLTVAMCIYERRLLGTRYTWTRSELTCHCQGFTARTAYAKIAAKGDGDMSWRCSQPCRSGSSAKVLISKQKIRALRFGHVGLVLLPQVCKATRPERHLSASEPIGRPRCLDLHLVVGHSPTYQ